MKKHSKSTYSVLVVDDEQKICELIKSFLSLSQHFDTIIVAHNSLQAIQKLQNQEFDLIITDQKMPGRDGLSFVEYLSKIPKYNGLKIIMASGYMTKETVIKAIDKGVQSILVKPFTRYQLLDCVYEALDLEKSPSSLSQDMIMRQDDKALKKIKD